MDELVNSLSNLDINEQTKKFKELKKFNEVIPDYVLQWIYKDYEYMSLQIINNHLQSVPVIFELFKNINMFSSHELRIIYDFVSKYGYYMLENKIKNTGLYYEKLDLQTYIDYYSNELHEQISMMEGC
jgi:hypothetical protein